jgi:hypothetical protein
MPQLSLFSLRTTENKLFTFKLKIMNQSDISEILVHTKYRVPTIKEKTAHFDVDIPLVSSIIAELSNKLCIQVELFNSDKKEWITTKRYYESSKDTMDFDLYSIEGKRKNIKILI